MSDRNLVALHRRQAERFGPRPALRFRRHGLFHDLTWNDYREAALACAAALVELGVHPGERVGLLAENRVEWLLADLGILTAAAVNVPPHAPLTAAQVQYQLADAEVSWLFVSTRAQFEKIQQIRGQLPHLRGLVVFDAALDDAFSWRGFLQLGRRVLARYAAELRRREEVLGLDDLATIMYTSGTTGNPKGVMLTHGNLLSNALATLEVAGNEPSDVFLSWLPYSHIYARTCDHYKTIAGGNLLYLVGSADTLIQDLADVQPTHMTAVPRFYEKVLAAATASDPAETGRRLRRIFGPRLSWLTAGGAPLSPAIAEAYRAAGLLVLQGYGLTECAPVISFNRANRYKLDTVGPPIPGVEVAIAPDGEVLTRGPHVMPGYWKDPQATAEALRDGWLHTGDLGELDADGFLKITGRKKELLVLSSGKKVVPSQLEGLLLADSSIDQAVVCGEGRNFLTALLVPQWDNLRRALGIEGTPETLAQSPEVYRFLEGCIERALSSLAPYERVKKFLVLPHPFTVEGEELTVSLKLRRNVVLKKYQKELDALYSSEEAPRPRFGEEGLG